MGENDEPAKESLLPYEAWAAEALRQVAMEALDHVARQGLPGGHHFYLTFLTTFPGVEIPAHLRARFPDEMTIVLQHQFWDLSVDRARMQFRVGLSFGGVPATLIVPFAALTAFADPEIQFGLRFASPVQQGEEKTGEVAPDAASPNATSPGAATAKAADQPASAPQVVSLDAFRQRGSSKE
ncbi:MAG: SspB family protein [Acetobacteraceae bacterium]